MSRWRSQVLRSRNDTIRLVVEGHVLVGIEYGRLERSLVDSPAEYRSAQRLNVAQEALGPAATSLIGTPLSTARWATLSP